MNKTNHLYAQHWVLWDGSCGFCQSCATWAQARDSQQSLKIVAYQQTPSPPMTPALYHACAEAIHVITQEGKILRAGRACLFILDHLGYSLLANMGKLRPFIWFVEIGYWLVARNRKWISRCQVTLQKKS